MFALGYDDSKIRVLNLLEDVLFIRIEDKRPVFWTRESIYVTPHRKEILAAGIGFVQINGSEIINVGLLDEISVVTSLHPKSRSKTFLQARIGNMTLPISEAARSEVEQASCTSEKLVCTLLNLNTGSFTKADIAQEACVISNYKKTISYTLTDGNTYIPPMTLDAFSRLLEPHYQLTDSGYLVNVGMIDWIEDRVTYGDIHFKNSRHVASMSGSYIRHKYGKFKEGRKILHYISG